MRRMRWLLISALLLAPLGAGAADMTIGVILSGNVVSYQDMQKSFAATIVEEGFDQRKAGVILQMPVPDALSWTNAARKLVVADVNVLVTYGAPATLAAIKETKGIPIVFAGVYDPVGVGAQARNTSGISAKVPMTSLLKYLKKLKAFTKIAVICNDAEPDSLRQLDELRQLEGQYGFQAVKMAIKRPEEAKGLSFQGKADAVLVSVSAAAGEAIDTIVEKGREAKIPVVSQTSGAGEHGAVLTLAPSPVEQGQVAARIAARLLRGEKPPAITVEVPKRVELVVNLKEAGSIGLTVPFDVLTDATRVIK